MQTERLGADIDIGIQEKKERCHKEENVTTQKSRKVYGEEKRRR